MTDNPFKQIYYREQLASSIMYLNQINFTIYHSLDELNEEFLYSRERIILCDTSVYQPGRDSCRTTILPISLTTAESLIAKLAREINVS